MKQTELLLPAGNISKMQYAIAYGADAVYLGVSDFSLRSMKSGDIITSDNIKEAVSIAHQMGAKAYVTVNIFAHNEDIEKLPAFLEVIADSKPDGLIFSDPGVFSVLKKEVPEIPLHLSTQANTLNYESVKFWKDLGVERIILARELALKEIEQIASKVPDIDLEVFIHGSLCVSYSGRCLLSNYLTNNTRKSNQGGCAQPCRWQYKLIEEKRPGEYIEITEDEKGAYILNPKDISLIKYLPDLVNAGVSSFKVEGRTKSMFYASIVANVYRKALDMIAAGKSYDADEMLLELSKVGNRGFTTGFLVEKPDFSHHDYSTSKGIAGSTFLGVILEKINDNTYKIKAKNQIKRGWDVEWLTPSKSITSRINGIINEFGGNVEIANTNDIIYLILDENAGMIEDWQWGIIRSKEEAKYGIQVEANLHS